MPLSKEQAAKIWETKRFAEFVAKANLKHANAYQYLDPVKTDEGKVRITCPEHGVFEQAPNKHLFGRGCPKCGGRLGPEDLLKKYQAMHPTLDFSLADLSDNEGDVTLICPTHGQFTKRRKNLAIGQGCPACGYERTGQKMRNKPEDMGKIFKDVHGDRYTYHWGTYTKSTSPMKMTCKEHGDFWQKPDFHRTGVGCGKCGYQAVSKYHISNLDNFIEQARKIHGDKYDYSKSVYVHSKEDIEIVCKTHGSFWQRPNNHLMGAICPTCSMSQTSRGELEVAEFVKSLGFELETGRLAYWDFEGKKKWLEMDVKVKDMPFAIEYDGLYWHGEQVAAKDLMPFKTNIAQLAGIKLIHIYEDEWYQKQDIVKARIRSMLGLAPRKVAARKCEIRQVPAQAARAFHIANHVQGEGPRGCQHYGLYAGDELVACATFGKAYLSEADYECYRYSTSISVQGGFSKLLKHFWKETPDCDTLVSYADLRWGRGEVYLKAGFEHVKDTEQGYYWCKGNMRHNRHNFMKHKLKNLLKNFDPALTEVQNLHNNGYWRIYDCGHAKYIQRREQLQKVATNGNQGSVRQVAPGEDSEFG